GIDDERIYLCSGQYFAALKKQRNTVAVGRKSTEVDIFLLTPKIGKPYTEEIAKAEPTATEFYVGQGYVHGKITYEIKAFPAIKLHLNLKLYSEGLLENYFEVEN